MVRRRELERGHEPDKSLLDPKNHDTDDNASRRQSAVKLKIAGASYSEVAEVLEYSTPATARRAIERALADLTATPEQVEHVRYIIDARLERLWTAVSAKANREGPEQSEYIKTALRVIDRKMALHHLAGSTVTINPSADRVKEVMAHIASLVVEDDAEADIMDAEIVDA